MKNNQRIKLLMIYELLSRLTDEAHALSTNAIVRLLKLEGIATSNRTLPGDIELLNFYGYEVLSYKKRVRYYYVRAGKLNAAEVTVLVDMLTASYSFDESKDLLVKKLVAMESCRKAEFCSKHTVYDEVTYSDKCVTRAIDVIETGISLGRKISFRYYDFKYTGERIYRDSDARPVFNPLTMFWDGRKHYLIAYKDDDKALEAYRLDRMDDVKIEDRAISDTYRDFDAKAHRRELRSLVSGKRETVRLKFGDEILQEVFDRFGVDVKISETEKGLYAADVDVSINGELFGWILSFGGEMAIEASPEIEEKFSVFMQRIKSRY